MSELKMTEYPGTTIQALESLLEVLKKDGSERGVVVIVPLDDGARGVIVPQHLDKAKIGEIMVLARCIGSKLDE